MIRNNGAMSGAGATTVPRWRSRRLEREETKNVLQKLDSFVPQHKRRAAQSNGAGARSIGAQGRTLNDVLGDVVEYIRTMKHDRESCSICREQPRACSKKHSAKAEQLGATHSGHLRERERMLARMLTSDDRILTAQVEIVETGTPTHRRRDWILREASGKCAVRLWGDACATGLKTQDYNLERLLHPHDFECLDTLWEQHLANPLADTLRTGYRKR
jgi:hypothetical protein